MIKLKNLIEVKKDDCECGGDCCSVNESKGMELGKIFTGHGFAFKKENFEESLQGGSLPNKEKDFRKIKKVKDEPDSQKGTSDSTSTFSKHHAGSMGSGDMGRIAEPDTYDWDDSGNKPNKAGHQTKKNKKKRGYEPVEETSERDYKAEYKKFQSSTKAKKYRAELNKYNRQKGTYGNGDGKDASHKGGKIVGFESQSKNRGRAEKSRLKKEELGKRCTVKEVSKWLKTLEEFRYRKVRGVDARRVASFVNNGMNEEELPISLQKKWEHKKYGREKHLANKYVETVLNISLKESVNETVIKENLISFYKYMGDFYGKKGIYPDKKGRDLKVGDINKALSVYLKKYGTSEFEGDTLDRERVRDILIKMRKLDPDYSKKESVTEGKNPKREKVKKDFKTSLNFAKGAIRKIETFMKSDYWGMADRYVTDKRTGLVSIVKDMEKSMNQIIKMPVDESINESVSKRITVKEVKKWMKTLEEFRYKRISPVDARRVTSFINNKLKEEELPQSLQKKWSEAKYSREKYLAARYLKSNKNTIKESKDCCDNCKEEKTCCSVSEEIQPQGNIKKVLDVVKNKQHTKIGGTLIDATTAGMMAQVWDKVNDSSKEKMNKMNVKQLINLILKLWKAVGTPRL